MWIVHRKEIRKLTFRALALRSDEGLKLETSASDSLYGGQFTLSTQLIKPNYLILNVDTYFIIWNVNKFLLLHIFITILIIYYLFIS